jgi:hypothetical protein
MQILHWRKMQCFRRSAAALGQAMGPKTRDVGSSKRQNVTALSKVP